MRFLVQNIFSVLLKTIIALILSLQVAQAQDVADSIAPEFSSGVTQKELVKAKSQMAVAANPYASNAGYNTLKKGGNAMVAVQTVLGLVEPQSSGLGGGAFLVYFDAVQNKLTTYDGRETAPKASTPDMFLDANGNPIGFFDVVIGGRSVGTPGTVKLLHETHKKYGKLKWSEVIAPAVELAEKGFKLSPRLNALISRSAESLYKYQPTRNCFLSEEGVPLFVGTIVTNKEYASTLRAISKGGADAFYKGELAKRIVNTVQNAHGNPGRLSLEDLSDYNIIEREPVCYRYRNHDVCGMGPPSSGALTVG